MISVSPLIQNQSPLQSLHTQSISGISQRLSFIDSQSILVCFFVSVCMCSSEIGLCIHNTFPCLKFFTHYAHQAAQGEDVWAFLENSRDLLLNQHHHACDVDQVHNVQQKPALWNLWTAPHPLTIHASFKQMCQHLTKISIKWQWLEF